MHAGETAGRKVCGVADAGSERGKFFYSGTMILDMIALVERVEREHDTRLLIAEELEVTHLIIRSNGMPIVGGASKA